MARLRHRTTLPSGPVKVTKPDGSVSYEEALSPRDMARLDEAERTGHPGVAQKIVRAKRKGLTPLGVKLEAARTSR